MEVVSIVVAVISAAFSFITYVQTFKYGKKKATIDSFNTLQNEVLDNFVSISRENAVTIVQNLGNEQFKKAYDDYRALIARLEHFAVGVNNKVYDFKVVDTIAGIHLVYLYKKVKPIIDKANEREQEIKYYSNFVLLAKKLNTKYKIEISGE